MKTPILKLFTSHRRWTKGVEARFKYIPLRKSVESMACSVDAGNGAAQCWCLSGAVTRCYDTPERRTRVLTLLLRAAHKIFPIRCSGGGIVHFNDHPDTTFADVMIVVRLAKV